MLSLLISTFIIQDTSRSIDMVGRDVRVEGVVDGDISLVRGNLDVLGIVKGDVSVVSGNIHLFDSAMVDGDITVVGGDIILDSNSVVTGDLAVVAGKLINRGGKIEGSIEQVSGGALNTIIRGVLKGTLGMVETKSGDKRIGRKEVPMVWVHFQPWISDILNMLILLVLVSLFFLLMRKFILKIADMMERDVWRNVLFGILSYILIVPLLFLLIISIVGILLVPVYLILLIIAFIVSISAGMVLVGRLIKENIGRQWGEWIDLLAGFCVYAALVIVKILVSAVFQDTFVAFIMSLFPFLYILSLSILGFGVLFKLIFRIEG